MAENSDNSFLYFMVGGLVIGVMGLGYFYYNGLPPAVSSVHNTTVIERTTIERVPAETPKKENPADNAGGSGY